MSEPHKSHEQTSQRNGPTWLWLLMIGAFALIFWEFVPRRAGPNPPPPPVSRIGMLAPIGVVVVVILAVVAAQLLRGFDLGVRRADRRARGGDLDGAIDDLRAQIEKKGASEQRVNALGVLLMRKQRWDEAVGVFRKAEETGPLKDVRQSNLGLALLKSGKPAEALSVLEDAARTFPQSPAMTCLIRLHTALALAELKRWSEAGDQMQLAEEATHALRGAQLAMFKSELENCRQKLEQHPRE